MAYIMAAAHSLVWLFSASLHANEISLTGVQRRVSNERARFDSMRSPIVCSDRVYTTAYQRVNYQIAKQV